MTNDGPLLYKCFLLPLIRRAELSAGSLPLVSLQLFSNPDCVNGLLSSSHLTSQFVISPLIFIVLFLFLSGLCEPFFHYYNFFKFFFYVSHVIPNRHWFRRQNQRFSKRHPLKVGRRDLGLLCYSEQQSQQLCRLARREPFGAEPVSGARNLVSGKTFYGFYRPIKMNDLNTNSNNRREHEIVF